jgi:uncharacterized damage-inducible protein DinB
MPVYISLTDRLKTQHLTIYELIDSVPDHLLHFRPAADKWNIKDQIAHMTRYQMIFLERVNLILLGQQPGIKRYDAELDSEFANWQNQPIEKLMERMVADRLNMFNLITRLSREKLNLVGTHEKYGALTVLQWTEFFLLHEAHHLYAIFQIANRKDVY